MIITYCSVRVIDVFVVSRVARVVAPKKAALKEAEAELAVAMEVRNYFYITLFTTCVNLEVK